jgi:hypothetical protein
VPAVKGEALMLIVSFIEAVENGSGIAIARK